MEPNSIIAVTTGTPTDPQLVCRTHNPGVILEEFTIGDLTPGQACADCGKVLGETPTGTYDGLQINRDWDSAWPEQGTDANDPRHTFSPVLQAPVANLLGAPWYLESGSPGGDFVTWLNLPAGGRMGVCPQPALDDTMRWAIVLEDEDGSPLRQEHDLPITEPAARVTARVRHLMSQWGITPPGA